MGIVCGRALRDARLPALSNHVQNAANRPLWRSQSPKNRRNKKIYQPRSIFAAHCVGPPLRRTFLTRNKKKFTCPTITFWAKLKLTWPQQRWENLFGKRWGQLIPKKKKAKDDNLLCHGNHCILSKQ